MTHPDFAGQLARAHMQRLRSDTQEQRWAVQRRWTDPPRAAGGQIRRPWAFDQPADPPVLDDPAGYSVLDDDAVQTIGLLRGAMGLTGLGGGLAGFLIGRFVWLLFYAAGSLRDSFRGRRDGH